MRGNRKLEQPTFAQTVTLIKTMAFPMCQDVDAIIQRHLALGFHYDKNQIHRAMKALTDPARLWDQRNRASASSRTSTRRSA